MQQLAVAALITLLTASAAELSGVALRLRPGYWLSAMACACAAASFSWLLADGGTVEFDLWSVAPSLELVWRMDALGAFLGIVVAVVGLFASIFAVQYSRPRRLDDALYPLFLLTMIGVAGAGNVFSFFAMWELMGLTSFLLVLGDGQVQARRMAALLYLGMTHVAAVLAMASLLLLADSAGSQDFAAIGLADAGPTTKTSIALLLALAGFGTKAGLIPLHIWLPRAHPVAPSHVSALMSAAMVATGIYGLVRVSLDFLGPGEAWWGIVVMAAGAVTAVLGVLYALMERDMKRCLAYSTVENMGIVTLAVGVALCFRAAGADGPAAAALLAGLVHTVNHALLKGLLFLGSGSIQQATHSLDMDRLGGLIRVMPLTGLAMLVGSLGLASVPPLNGFAGEWMLTRSMLSLAGSDVGIESRLAGIAGLGMLALTAGLALACFVRLFGMVFLGISRSAERQDEHRSRPLMTVPLLGLALASLAAAAGTPGLVRLLRGVPQSLVGSSGANVESAHRLALDGGGSFSPAVLAITLLFLAPVPWFMLRLFFGSQRSKRAPVWATGVAFSPGMQYSATSLSKPIRLFFRRILVPERQVQVEYHGSSQFPRRIQYTGRVPAVIEEQLYLPLRKVAIWSAHRIRGVQHGSVELYLLYIFAALLALLVVAR